MTPVFRVLRSLVFDAFFYVSMAVMGVICLPLLVTRRSTIWAIKVFCHLSFWALRRICGLKVEIRGEKPSGPAIIACQHQSFLDVIMVMAVAPAPVFVMKRSLIFAPFLGFYALRIGARPINRAGGQSALKAMVRGMLRMRKVDPKAQLVIFPQGTRVRPGGYARYQRGVGVLYVTAADLQCNPVATNAGDFWPKGGFWRKSGVAVLEFLPPIPPGLSRDEFMARVEHEIESASARLAASRC